MKPPAEILNFSRSLRDVRLRPDHGPQADAERLRERDQENYERGLRDGEKSLREQLLRQRGELIAVQNGVLNSLRHSLSGLVMESEKALVALALDVARRVVAGTPVSVEMVEGMVREAVTQLEEHGDLTVLLNPADLTLLEQVNSPTLLAEVGGEKMRFAASPAVSPGGCLVKTRFGSVDSRRETRWNLVNQSLGLA